MSLISGWFPITLQLLALAVLLASIGWRTRTWRVKWVAIVNRLFVKFQGWRPAGTRRIRRTAPRQRPRDGFPDATGRFNNDTECVNGPRGNAADHLIKDVVPYVVSRFGVSANSSNWGLVGWSSGGTCALIGAAMHPDLFSAFVALDGQLGPRTVIEQHGSYPGLSACSVRC